MSTEKTERRDCWDSEDAEVDVPKNIFRCHETWVLYEVTRSTKHFLMVELFCSLIFCSCTAMYIPPSLWDLTLIVFMLVASVIWSAVICMTLVERRAGYLIRNTTKLAEATREVFSLKQENLVLGWDKVASVLNRKFYIAGDWKTPYCIFDGAKCENYFRRHVLKSMAEEDASEDCEKSCLRAAVDIYRRRVIDQFEWDKYDTPVLADDNFLADSHHNEFIWRLRNTLKDLHFIGYFVPLLFVLLVGTRSSRLLCMIMTIFMFATIAARPSLNLCTTRSRIRLLATIADVAPREDMDRWDVVARRMNAYLSQDFNSDAGIFFDGKDYLEFFEKQLKPLMSKKIKDYRVATYELVPLIADVVEGPST